MSKTNGRTAKRGADSLDRLVRRFRHRKTTRVLPYNPWNFDFEPGDLLIDHDHSLHRAVESRGRNQRAAGELTTVRIKPPQLGLKAKVVNGVLWWYAPNI